MKAFCGWSKLCDKSNCLNRLPRISQYRYFNSIIEEVPYSDKTKTMRSVLCTVRTNVRDSGRKLVTAKHLPESRFLKTMSVLCNKPAEVLKPLWSRGSELQDCVRRRQDEERSEYYIPLLSSRKYLLELFGEIPLESNQSCGYKSSAC